MLRKKIAYKEQIWIIPLLFPSLLKENAIPESIPLIGKEHLYEGKQGPAQYGKLNKIAGIHNNYNESVPTTLNFKKKAVHEGKQK